MELTLYGVSTGCWIAAAIAAGWRSTRPSPLRRRSGCHVHRSPPPPSSAALPCTQLRFLYPQEDLQVLVQELARHPPNVVYLHGGAPGAARGSELQAMLKVPPMLLAGPEAGGAAASSANVAAAVAAEAGEGVLSGVCRACSPAPEGQQGGAGQFGQPTVGGDVLECMHACAPLTLRLASACSHAGAVSTSASGSALLESAVQALAGMLLGVKAPPGGGGRLHAVLLDYPGSAGLGERLRAGGVPHVLAWQPGVAPPMLSGMQFCRAFFGLLRNPTVTVPEVWCVCVCVCVCVVCVCVWCVCVGVCVRGHSVCASVEGAGPCTVRCALPAPLPLTAPLTPPPPRTPTAAAGLPPGQPHHPVPLLPPGAQRRRPAGAAPAPAALGRPAPPGAARQRHCAAAHSRGGHSCCWCSGRCRCRRCCCCRWWRQWHYWRHRERRPVRGGGDAGGVWRPAHAGPQRRAAPAGGGHLRLGEPAAPQVCVGGVRGVWVGRCVCVGGPRVGRTWAAVGGADC